MIDQFGSNLFIVDFKIFAFLACNLSMTKPSFVERMSDFTTVLGIVVKATSAIGKYSCSLNWNTQGGLAARSGTEFT